MHILLAYHRLSVGVNRERQYDLALLYSLSLFFTCKCANGLPEDNVLLAGNTNPVVTSFEPDDSIAFVDTTNRDLATLTRSYLNVNGAQFSEKEKQCRLDAFDLFLQFVSVDGLRDLQSERRPARIGAVRCIPDWVDHPQASVAVKAECELTRGDMDLACDNKNGLEACEMVSKCPCLVVVSYRSPSPLWASHVSDTRGPHLSH